MTLHAGKPMHMELVPSSHASRADGQALLSSPAGEAKAAAAGAAEPGVLCPWPELPDQADSPEELTAAAQHQQQQARRLQQQYEQQREQVKARLQQLRQRLAECLAANEAAPEAERLPAADLLVNASLRAELEQQGQEKAEQVGGGMLQRSCHKIHLSRSPGAAAVPNAMPLTALC